MERIPYSLNILCMLGFLGTNATLVSPGGGTRGVVPTLQGFSIISLGDRMKSQATIKCRNFTKEEREGQSAAETRERGGPGGSCLELVNFTPSLEEMRKSYCRHVHKSRAASCEQTDVGSAWQIQLGRQDPLAWVQCWSVAHRPNARI